MRDMFDDFMEELRRRQAEAARQRGEAPKDEGEAPDEDADAPDDHDTGVTHDEDDRPEPDDEPIPVRGARGGGGNGGFGRVPPRRVFTVGGEELPPFNFRRGPLIIFSIFVGLILLVLLLGSSLVTLVTDAMWYQSVGFANVFWARIGWQVLYFAAGALVAAIFLWFNVWLAGRVAPPGPRRRVSLDDFFERMVERDAYTPRVRQTGAESIEIPDFNRPLGIGLSIIAVFVALGFGGILASSWETIQLWLHQSSFGVNDPTFGNDAGFYVFQLPVLRLAQSYANSLALVALVFVGIRYALAVVSGAPLKTAARVHLGLLVGGLLALTAVGYQLDKYELVFGDHGAFSGVNYTDANARFLALNALTVLAAFAAAFVIGFAYTRWIAPLTATIVIWLVANVALSGIYPLAVQRFVVDPNTQTQESPFVQRNIDMTRYAFGFNNWKADNNYVPSPTLTQAAINQETATLDNARLWDVSPLKSAFEQLQVVAPYYSFKDVDTDRYVFNGTVRQVMLAGRQFDAGKYEKTTTSGVSWVNQHVNYTHGVGVAMVPVRNVGPDGRPQLVIQNLPPQSTEGAPNITQPRLYFSDTDSDYVIVGAKSPEFDYPSAGSGQTTTNWTGRTGIKLDNTLMRLLFAARFGDFNLLISDQVTADSQLLFRRNMLDRVQAVAPFLRYDKDPYLVIGGDGRLVYMLDAYTVTDRFPNSRNFDPGSDPSTDGLAGDPFNYIRNSVKIVMDAYDGTMTFYVADPSDPLIKAWQAVFPGLFTSFDKMPADLRAHVRYPEDMFNAQTVQYERYHVTDPIQFQQNSDVWAVPYSADQLDTSPIQLGIQAYYLQMRLPNDPNPEFLLLAPMTRQNRPNMIAWIAARNDPANYGQVEVFEFPRDTTTFGPLQLESQIRVNPDISQQISLWDQAGSRVIMGNLLVIPLQNTLIYIEPVYLQAQGNPLPEFQRVVVATPSQVVWGTTLQDALNQILAGKGQTGPGASPSPSTSPSPSVTPSPTATASTSVGPGSSGTPLPTDVQSLVAEANRHYELAQQALAKGDFATYGNEMNQVRDILSRLQTVVGTPAPKP